MRWRRIDKASRKQPDAGGYSDWKPDIAECCSYRCVYCGIHESRYGGIDNFHVDHFRPKSIPRFAELRDVITNLYLACAICNRFKSNDWPNDPMPDNSIAAYPDPSDFDYTELFAICTKTFRISGTHVATRYVIERIGLNRTQLLIDRRTDALLARFDVIDGVLAELEQMVAELHDNELQHLTLRLLKAQRDTSMAMKKVLSARPYEPGEQKKNG